MRGTRAARLALPAWDAATDEGAVDAPPSAVARRHVRARHVKTVSEVSRAIRERVRADDGLRDLWVEGEVGRVTVSTAGHAYFALKDARAQLQCVWFRDERVRSAFQPQTGLQVVVHGRMDVFEPQGALQLYVESLQPSGFGNLAIRFEQLKARLAAEGLFDAGAQAAAAATGRASIAVVTSPTGAVWRDVCNVLARRWPLARVVLVACQVQGDGAPASIVGALRRARALDRASAARDGRADDAPAVTILARGGGSLEDLWSFNDERVVRGDRRATRCRSCAAWATRSTSRWPTSPPTCARRPRRRRRSSSSRTGSSSRGAPRPAIPARRRRARRRSAAARARSRRSGGSSTGSTRRVRLVESRERAGLLLDRATRATLARVDDGARSRGAGLGPPARARGRPSWPGRGAALDAIGVGARRPSARRRRSSGATRSSAGEATTASCGTRPRRRPARACGSRWPAGTSPRRWTPIRPDAGDRGQPTYPSRR